MAMVLRLLSLALILFVAQTSVATTTVLTFEAGWFTSGGVEGTAPVGADVEIEFTTTFGVKTVKAAVDAKGHYHQSLPAAVVGTDVKVSSPLCPAGTLPSKSLTLFNRLSPGRIRL